MVLFMTRAMVVALVFGFAAFVGDAALREAGRPRRWVWLWAIALSTVVPFLAPLFPVRGIGVPATMLPSDARVLSLLERATTDTALALLWAMSSLALLALFSWAHRRARRAASGAQITVAGVEVILSERIGPAVVGIVSPTIVVPQWALAASGVEQGLMVKHESEHVRARDTWILAVSALGVIVMPWNPVLWWQHRRVRRAVEGDCDSRVLASGCDLRAYGATLLSMAARASCLTPAVSMLGTPRLLEQRIRDMTAIHGLARTRRLAPLTVLGFALAISAVAAAVPYGRHFAGSEVIVVRPGTRAQRANPRASLVLLDGRPSSYEELRTFARQARLGPLKHISPEQAIRRYGARAATGALIANSK